MPTLHPLRLRMCNTCVIKKWWPSKAAIRLLVGCSLATTTRCPLKPWSQAALYTPAEKPEQATCIEPYIAGLLNNPGNFHIVTT